MPANLVFRRKNWGARDNGIPPRSTPKETSSTLLASAETTMLLIDMCLCSIDLFT